MRKVSLVVVLMSLIAAGLVPGAAHAQRRDEVEILDDYAVEPGALVVTVTATGVIEPERSVGLNFEASSPVIEVLVQEGDSVRVGDTLALLDADELRAALREAEIALELQQLAYEALVEPPRNVDVAAAEASVAASEAAVDAAGFGPTQEQIQIARVQAELARNQLWQTQLTRDIRNEIAPMFRGGMPDMIRQEANVTGAELDVAVAQANIEATIRSGGGLGAIGSAEAQLVQAQIALEDLLNGPDKVDLLKFEIQLDQAELAVERARTALEQSELLAPFNGIVAQDNLIVGEVPPANLPALQLVDNSAYYVELAIDESDVVDIAVGQPVLLRLDALPEADVTGAITRISITPDPTSTTVVYRARVQLDPSDANIRVGMSTTATITTQELNDVLVVPNRFVRIDRQTQQAFVTIQNANGRFEEIPIVLGERNANVSQVLSGLEPGQRIVQVPRETLGLDAALDGPPDPDS